jgi:hypothetical protein
MASFLPYEVVEISSEGADRPPCAMRWICRLKSSRSVPGSIADRRYRMGAGDGGEVPLEGAGALPPVGWPRRAPTSSFRTFISPTGKPARPIASSNSSASSHDRTSARQCPPGAAKRFSEPRDSDLQAGDQNRGGGRRWSNDFVRTGRFHSAFFDLKYAAPSSPYVSLVFTAGLMESAGASSPAGATTPTAGPSERRDGVAALGAVALSDGREVSRLASALWHACRRHCATRTIGRETRPGTDGRNRRQLPRSHFLDADSGVGGDHIGS